MRRHWVAVTVMVPVDTDHPSAIVAEHTAMQRVEREVERLGATATAASWSRQEPLRRPTPGKE